jgi:acetoin:2,6-dichlorophenolindophenol oxidoreductase subunit alpha
VPRRDPRSSADAGSVLAGMWTIRRFEEGLEELFTRGLLHGTMHLSIGQEAVAEGVCATLGDGDLITSTHRGHGHALAHGADPVRMMAELLMKDTGYCRGRGGSMHIADVARGNLGANGIVAGSMTIAAGAALTQKLRDTGKVVVCFFGDGAANEGSFHEALNLAGVWGLPVVWLCENNQYGMSMAQDESTAGGSVARRADAYGLPGVRADGNDVVDVFEKTLEAVDRARSGGGATLVECITYRYRGHSKSDRNLYRTQDEIEDWRSNRDPLARYEGMALERGLLDHSGVEAARDRARETIRHAIAAAFAQPDATVHDLDGAAYA